MEIDLKDSAEISLTLKSQYQDRDALKEELFKSLNKHDTGDIDEVGWEEDLKYSIYRPQYGNIICPNGPMYLYVAHKKDSSHEWSYMHCHSDTDSDTPCSNKIIDENAVTVHEEEIVMSSPSKVLQSAAPCDIAISEKQKVKKQKKKITLNKFKYKKVSKERQRNRSGTSSGTSCSDSETHSHTRFPKKKKDESDNSVKQIKKRTKIDNNESDFIQPKEVSAVESSFPLKDSVDMRPSSMVESSEIIDIEVTEEAYPDFQQAQVNQEITPEKFESLKQVRSKQDLPKVKTRGRRRSGSSCSHSSHSNGENAYDTIAEASHSTPALNDYISESKVEAPLHSMPLETKVVENTYHDIAELDKVHACEVIKDCPMESVENDNAKKSSWKDSLKKRFVFRDSKAKKDKSSKSDSLEFSASTSNISESHTSTLNSNASEKKDSEKTDKSKQLLKLPKIRLNKVKKETKEKTDKNEKQAAEDGASTVSRKTSTGTSCSDDTITKHTKKNDKFKKKKIPKNKQENESNDKEKSSHASISSNNKPFDKSENNAEEDLNDYLLVTGTEVAPIEKDIEDFVVKEEEVKCFTLPTRPRDFEFDEVVDLPYKSLNRELRHVSQPLGILIDAETQYPPDEIIDHSDHADKFLIATENQTMQDGCKDRSTQADITYCKRENLNLKGSQSLPARLSKCLFSSSSEPYLDVSVNQTIPHDSNKRHTLNDALLFNRDGISIEEVSSLSTNLKISKSSNSSSCSKERIVDDINLDSISNVNEKVFEENPFAISSTVSDKAPLNILTNDSVSAELENKSKSSSSSSSSSFRKSSSKETGAEIDLHSIPVKAHNFVSSDVIEEPASNQEKFETMDEEQSAEINIMDMPQVPCITTLPEKDASLELDVNCGNSVDFDTSVCTDSGYEMK